MDLAFGIDKSANIWRNIPNAISIARLCATVVMLAAVLLHRAAMFKWLLLFCLLSDLLDGQIARIFQLVSEVGAFLDSVADVATMVVGLIGVLVFQQLFVAEHYRGLLIVMAFYFAEVIASFWRYGRVSSFHTLLTRVAAFMAGAFVLSLFFWGYFGWLYQKTFLVYILALSEEMLLIYFLPEWQCDVGGIYRQFFREPPTSSQQTQAATPNAAHKQQRRNALTDEQ